MNNKIILWSITVALAGFLFGFDTIVISGAEQTLQNIWGSYELFGSNDNFHGYIVVGSALFGTIERIHLLELECYIQYLH